MGQFGSGDDGGVGDLDTVVHFVFFLQSPQDGDGGFHRGFTHDDFLETALQRSIFLDEFAVLVQGGGAHAMQLATGQRRLEHVARVHRTFGLARPHHGVQFVNEDDGLAFVFGQLLEHRLEALLELATVLGPGQQGRHVERQDALALERLGHFTGHNALGQPFHNGGLAHAGFANQHRVVFAATL